MEMADFNGYKQNQRMYGGTAGRKMGISYHGKEYILKFPGNLKEQGMKNMMTIQEHPFLQDVLGIKEHFWNMFVVDALLGNPDRNNSNWGIILGMDGSKRIAPVYDNGNCLNCKWDEEKMLEVLLDKKKLETESYKGRRCIFEMEGKKINPYHVMESMEYPECTEAVKRLVPIMGDSLSKISDLIEEIPVLSEVQKKFYCCVMEADYMYNDSAITLPASLPDGLQSDFKELQEYYDAGDWLQFDLLFEAVEASVKAHYLAGKISREERNLIFKKYGIA